MANRFWFGAKPALASDRDRTNSVREFDGKHESTGNAPQFPVYIELTKLRRTVTHAIEEDGFELPSSRD